MYVRILVWIVALAGWTVAVTAQSRVPTSIVVINARSVAATYVAVEVGTRLVSLLRPLPSGAQATLRLPAGGDCAPLLAVKFADEETLEARLDICSDRVVRLTD